MKSFRDTDQTFYALNRQNIIKFKEYFSNNE